ncbi:TolC family protein [Niabella beijingensis]|uniref:TolC family protein n=1 Tax=Niabella beijingensis TaxID=2872700 RepID=UPI001CBE09B6|nr:TolC family protein [Niabella beijingensis]MBZ4187823.1 TolC family protein [Niabella beijingensis]
MRKRVLFLIFLFAGVGYCHGQPDGLTLPECYHLAEQNYPLIKRYELIRKATGYTIDNLQKGYLPQLSVYAQASYQSAVTELPVRLPGMSVPSLSKDQYKAYAQVDQVLYDGGAIRLQKELAQSSAAATEQQVAADLYQVRARINQLFFGILLTDARLKQNELLLSDLQLGLKKMQAAIKNGTAFRSNADLISADILTAGQHTTELLAARNAFADMLGQFIGKPVDEATVLQKPPPAITDSSIKRPELKVFDAQQKNLEIQNRLLTNSTRPRVGLFLQGGLGRPALNMLSNEFQGYYLGGIRLSWSPSSFYTLKKKRAAIDISRQEITVQEEAFRFNTGLSVKQQTREMGKYRQLLASDQEIIRLRRQVKTAAMAQLENGVITSTDFLKQVHDEDRARQNQLQHELELLLSQYDLQTITGNQP